MHVWLWLIRVFGVLNESSQWYAWWSGSGSVFVPPLISILGIYLLWRWHSRCQIERCVRLSRHDADGHKICHHHAGRHKVLTIEHLKHYHRTGVMPKPALPTSGHANQEEIQ